MTNKVAVRLLLVVTALVLTALGAKGIDVVRDERKLSSIGVGMRAGEVERRLGNPEINESYRVGNLLLDAPAACGSPATVSVYLRGNFRDSLLVYYDNHGRVACVQRRGISRY